MKITKLVLTGFVAMAAMQATLAQDLVSGGKNSWILHTPDDGRTTMYVAPYTNNKWDWGNGTYFFNDGSIIVNGDVKSTNKVSAREIVVSTTPTADFVFEESYDNPSLESVEAYIKANKHLPEIPAADEMEQNGVNVGTFQIQLLQKIEELTLHMIDMNKRMKALEAENAQLRDDKE